MEGKKCGSRYVGIAIVVVTAVACSDILGANFNGAHLRTESGDASADSASGGAGEAGGRQSEDAGGFGGRESGGATGGAARNGGNAGSGETTSTGGVPSTGGASNAGGAGVDAGDGSTLGSAGQLCSPNGAYACAGHAQKGQLVCSNGRWQSNGNCSGTDNCDSSPGPSAGSCQPIVQECDGKYVGDIFCRTTDRLSCGIDLVTTAELDTCPYLCTDGACTGTCMPATRQCDMLTPETCDGTGNWTMGAACTNLCSGGACSGTCSPSDTQCNGQVVQTCDSSGTWRDGTACSAQACVGGKCVGICAPGTKQCANNGVETCSSSGAWNAPTACVSSACVSGACSGVCVPATKWCAGNGVETCSSNGRWGTASPCAARNQTCSNGACVACAPGLAGCDGGGGTGCVLDAGLAICGNDCVDLTSDDMNCGACGYACVNGRHCVNGVPTPPWLPITTSGAPPPRTGFRAVGVSGTMVLAGGSPASATTNVYDSSTDSWPAASPMSTPRCEHGMVSSGTRAYVFGGLTDCSSGKSALANLEEYNPSSRSWNVITASGAPEARYALGLAWTGTEVFVYGGSSSTKPAVSTGGRYRVSAGTWADASGSLAVVNPVLFESGSGLYLWGGAVLSNGNDVSNTTGEQYTIASGWITWTVPNQVLPGANPDDGSRIFVVATSGTGCLQATQVKIYDRSKGTLLRTDDASAPNGIINALAIVWSGSEVIAWSGGCGASPTNGGGRYQPAAPN